MGTGKPLISILMAVYEPHMEWLREQLASLEMQTYPNLRLYVRDDCSSATSFAETEKLVKECIHSFPYDIKRNEKNLGSNQTFERLTKEAKGAYFAYCDQDDIWLPEKLTVLQEEIEKTGALVVCSDMFIIDETGRQLADSMVKVRKRHRFQSGNGLAKGLLISNFVTGCSMLVREEAAKAAVPFCPHMVHDHYIALWCAERGAIQSIGKPLIRYRIHGKNQTNLMAGVYDKASYGSVRIRGMLKRLRWLEENFPCGDALREELENALLWAQAREKNWYGRKGKAMVWKYRKYSLIYSIFEIFAPGMPEKIFQLCLLSAKKNWI